MSTDSGQPPGIVRRFRANRPLRGRYDGPTVHGDRSALWGWVHATRSSPVEGRRGLASGRKVGALAACMLLIAACSSGGGADETIVPSSTTTTEPIVRTTDLTAESSAATTTTGAATTTPVSPTTFDPVVEVTATVRAAVDEAISDFSGCLLALPNCDVSLLAATRADPMLATNASRITEWNAAGFAVIDRDQFRYVVESVELADDMRQATVTVCVADGSKLVDPGAGPGGADLIIDDTYASGREAWDMRLDDDGVWRAHDAPGVGPTEATDVCPAA